MSRSLNQTSSTAINRARVADKIGICLSGLCLIHCLLTPVLLLALPGLALASFSTHHLFHEALLLVLPAVALAAFLPGYRRHRNLSVFFWSVPAFSLMALAVTVFHDAFWVQSGLTIAGSLLLIKAHLLNRRLCACCESHPRSAS